MDDMFSIELHHGGIFEKSHLMTYLRGNITEFEKIDPDMMSYIEVQRMATRLGYGVISEVFYKVPYEWQQFREVKCDLDVFRMFYDHDAHGKISVVKLYIVALLLNGAENEVNSDADLGWDYLMSDTQLITPVSSEYSPSDELISLCEFDDECVDSGYMHQDYIPSRDLGEKELELGMKFGSAADFRLALRESALKNKFDIMFTRNDGDMVTAVCKAECGWRIHASKPENEDCLIIKTYVPEHTNCLWFHTNGQASSTFLANKYCEQVTLNPKIPLGTLKSTIASEMNIDVSTHKVYRAKRKALAMIEGNDVEQYGKMRDYCSLILRTNPGNVVKIQTEPIADESVRRFQRVFICYAAMIAGFKQGCRPLIGVDGCFLKGPYGGHLLSAVSMDGNGQMFPVVIAVVESETRDSWEWFMGELMDAVGPYNDITFISDRQKVQCQKLNYNGCHFCFKCITGTVPKTEL
ncbi:uncharacterized protein LOC132316625 [Cornus florida]|uniref:uncharacterized protein LOC132316625 n=1 Tax=Cornus florida TaxID=4283 RepID=UPI00289DA2B6|nr:uncharacterized protein LOC132316625 [Cornus florida]